MYQSEKCVRKIVYLLAKLENETIIKRIYKSKKRPLVMKLNKNQIRNLINERLKYYNLSDHKIDCDKLDKVEIINKILNIYEDRKN